MDAPRCRLCGKPHWLNEPCNFGDVEAEPEVTAEFSAARTENASQNNRPKTATAENSAPDKPPFDRKRYQRDYMRRYMPRWRAKRAQRLTSASS